jgi:hypothetical protein
LESLSLQARLAQGALGGMNPAHAMHAAADIAFCLPK